MIPWCRRLKIVSAYRLITNYSIKRKFSSSSDGIDENVVLEELKTTLRSIRLSGDPHHLLVVQPFVKWGPKTNKVTTPQLKLDEAVALVESLSGWRVLESRLTPVPNFDLNTFFTKGHLEELIRTTRSRQQITAVFVNVKTLQLPQHLFLEQVLQVPVFDRHSIVINIFKQHSKTKESKLQVSLAEIPYFWSRIKGINEGESFQVTNVGIGSGETFEEKRLQILRDRERKIKLEIQKLRENRQLLRAKRKEMEFPTVAVVGYTNSGKTSLIKVITESSKLEPQNKLFATLDVTLHAAELPTNVKILLIDTIGFISDVPTNLLEPFVATLEDAIQADVIVHVQDLSHPDRLAQETTVLNTLATLNLPSRLLDTIITVGNKADKVLAQELPDNVLAISCKTGFGLDEFIDKLEAQVYENTGLKRMKIKVSSGGEEYYWLRKEATVYSAEQDETNLQFIILGVAITETKLSKFKHKFIFKSIKPTD